MHRERNLNNNLDSQIRHVPKKYNRDAYETENVTDLEKVDLLAKSQSESDCNGSTERDCAGRDRSIANVHARNSFQYDVDETRSLLLERPPRPPSEGGSSSEPVV